jgi:hypothetical protein
METNEVYKALAVMDDTTKQDPMKTLDGLSNNFTEVPKDTANYTNYDKPQFAAVEVGVLAVFFIAIFFLNK